MRGRGLWSYPDPSKRRCLGGGRRRPVEVVLLLGLALGGAGGAATRDGTIRQLGAF